MSVTRAHRALIGIVLIWIVVISAVVGWTVWRGEDTRHTSLYSAACARALGPSPSETDIARCVEADRLAVESRPMATDCIIMRRTLRHGWYGRITRCPDLK